MTFFVALIIGIIVLVIALFIRQEVHLAYLEKEEDDEIAAVGGI
jgi:hypothetical protein